MSKLIFKVGAIIFSLAFILVSNPKIAEACSVLPATHQERFNKADAVFVGRVSSVATSSEGELRLVSGLVDVDRYWKGNLERKIKITSSGMYTCSPGFSTQANGGYYLIYANRNAQSGDYVIDILGMKLVADAANEMAALGIGKETNIPTDSSKFNRDLSVGVSGSDVSALQSWLINNGYDIPAISSGAATKGYFGAQTKVAIMKYQLANGIPNTGFVGPLTRGKLNGGGVNIASIKVISPNGGEVFNIGSTQTIVWNTSSVSESPRVNIQLVQNISGCFNNANIRPCLAVVDPEEVIATNIPNTGSYQWIVASKLYVAGSQSNNNFIRICKGSGQGVGSCDTSDSTFSIVASDSRAPVINGIDAPTTLSVNQTGTWTVRATDPQNGTLSYSVDWGDIMDVYLNRFPGSTEEPFPFVQNTSFSHSYVKSGTYTIRFKVRNSAGLVAQSSATVVVNNNNISSLRVISPNGGETWQKGTTQTITWTASAYFRATNADIKLVEYLNCPIGSACVPIAPMSYNIASNVSINQNSYSWRVGDAYPVSSTGEGLVGCGLPSNPCVRDGQYTIQICETGTNNCDSSNKEFTIFTDDKPKVLSPNGGESWLSNSVQAIRWDTYKLDANTKLDLYLDQADIYCITAPCGSTHILDKNIPVSTIYNWIVATDISNVRIPDGSYRVRVCTAGSTTNCDSSDASFRITSTATY